MRRVVAFYQAVAADGRERQGVGTKGPGWSLACFFPHNYPSGLCWPYSSGARLIMPKARIGWAASGILLLAACSRPPAHNFALVDQRPAKAEELKNTLEQAEEA